MENDENSFELVENREAIELVPTWELQWWWFAVALVAVGLVVLVVCLARRKKVAIDPGKTERQAYLKASEAFRTMETGDGRDSAVRISVILRAYLAESLGEPALFETHEEFIGRHDALASLPEEKKVAVSDFFTELAAMKYGPEKPGDEAGEALKTRGEALLERIHAA